MNTADTTVQSDNGKDIFIVTGDIPAMWLRDSTAQVNHYIPYANESDEANTIIRGLIDRQMDCILHDPYANAFNKEANNHGYQDDDTDMTPEVWERKYEIDSLCYPIRLMYRYWKQSGQTDIFNEKVLKVLHTIVDLWIVEQKHENSSYHFNRKDCVPTDTLTHDGRGTPVGYTGMTWSGFRPSDDACTYGYLVPSNMFAKVVLGYVIEISQAFYQDIDLESKAQELQDDIQSGIDQFAHIQHPKYGEIYAYEVDGLGNSLMTDDANIPSLLSLPYIGYCDKSDPVYQNTRAYLLSPDNPYYFANGEIRGIGSPHTPNGYIWPLALCIEGFTSKHLHRKVELVELLARCDGDTKLIHEGFNVANPFEFTRDWFAWGNSLFAEFVVHVLDEGGKL